MSEPERRVTLIVDGREIEAVEGEMLVDAAKHGDVEIPVFCYEPKLGAPVGACRMCMVEIEGMPKLQTACSTPVRDGMVVYTRNEQVVDAQNAVVEFLLVNHPLDCPVCDKGGECPLQDISMGWGTGRSRFTDAKRHFEKPIPLSPLVAIDRERCILCYRCVRFSQEVAEDAQLQLLQRGNRSYVGTFDERPYVAPFHGNITELCPVGALTSYTYRFRARPWDIEQAGSVCTLCPSQCNVSFTVRDEKVVRVLARDNPEVDDGWLCDKGRYSFEMLRGGERITGPALRSAGGSGVGWPEALESAAKGLRATGPATAAIVGDASNEEAYLLQRLLREALGSPHLESRIAAGPAREALLALSEPRIGARVRDIDSADAVLVLGTDPLHSSPILDLRIRKAVRRNGARLAVATERPTALDGGAAASARYAPGDAAGFLSRLGAALAGQESGDDGAADVAAVLRDAERPVVVWGERIGLGEGGNAAIDGLLGLAEGLGIRSAEGSGLLEVPEAANARGLREAGCLPDAGPGLAAAEAGHDTERIRAALESGEIRGLLLFGVDPGRDFPDAAAWARAVSAAEFVVCFSMLRSGAAAAADVVFPLESHAEKDGTVTHPDGRLQRVRPGAARPGDVRPAWQVLAELSAALGEETGVESAVDAREAVSGAVPFYAGLTDEEVGGRGVRWQEREAAAGFPEGGPSEIGGGGRTGEPPRKAQSSLGGTPVLPSQLGSAGALGGEPAAASSEGSQSFDGPAGEPPRKAQSSLGGTPAGPGDAGESPRGTSAEGEGLELAVGRYRDIWAGPETELNPALRFLRPEQTVDLSPADAARLGVERGERVSVSVNGASLSVRVAIRERVAEGTCFLIERTAEDNANLLPSGAGTVRIEKGAGAVAR
ncbi:MAG: NADH-quinone oxidoreductase subunit NuoG [Solirubrobacterales bacterium]